MILRCGSPEGWPARPSRKPFPTRMRSVRHSKKSPSFIGSRNSEDLVGLNGKDLYAPPRRAATGRLDRAEKKRLLQSIRRLREVNQLLSRIFAERRHSDQIDLEAVENAFRTALHQAGAAGLTELLRTRPPLRSNASCRVPAVTTRNIRLSAPSRFSACSDRPARFTTVLPVFAMPSRTVSRRRRTGRGGHGSLPGRAPNDGAGGRHRPLRSRPPTVEDLRRAGGNHQSGGADRGSDRRKCRRA